MGGWVSPFQGLEGGFPPWCCFLQISEEIKREVRDWLVCACVFPHPHPPSLPRFCWALSRTPKVPACPPPASWLAGWLACSLPCPRSCAVLRVWIQTLPSAPTPTSQRLGYFREAGLSPYRSQGRMLWKQWKALTFPPKHPWGPVESNFLIAF